jgi:hypothetical protein
MACTSATLNGIALDCGNVGGLKALYIVDILDVTGITVASGKVTAIEMAEAKKFKLFSFRKGNANFASTGNGDDAAGTNFVETVTTAQFNKMETAKRTEMQALVSANTYVIAQDYNGAYWFIGYDSYNNALVNAASGAAMADANAYTITLTAQTSELPMEVESTVIATII